MVDECGFIDLGFSGHQFTWQKHFSTSHSIWERLDHALASNDWLLRFAGTKVQHLTADSSDHCPLWINTVGLDFHNAPHFSTGHSIWERLDHALATNDWLLRFVGTKVQHLTADSSNHCPLWINTVGLDFHNAPKLFRFEEMWLSDQGCTKIVEAI